MGQFNEIQKGQPDLGKNYWQDLHKSEEDANQETDIIKINCQTIFNSENFNSGGNKPIFDK